MAYRIYAFDGLQLSEYMQDGDDQNMGTGSALSSYIQLPGGYYNNYTGLRAPQGIRPITKKCLLVGDNDNAIQERIKEVRAKLGIEGKLTIEWDNGDLWWQWATLKDCDTPQVFDFRGAKMCPANLRFESAAQNWFKVIVSAAEWTWGDGTWTFGDGTAEFGESGTLEDLTVGSGSFTLYTVNHGGNIDAKNVAITVTAGTTDITSLQIVNQTRRETITIGTDVPAGEILTINGGDRSVWLYSAALSIGLIENDLGTTTSVTTTTNHGLSSGDDVYIAGTGVDGFNGIKRNITVTGLTQFTFASSTVTTDGEADITVGTVQKVTSVYDNFADNSSKWPVLSPGDNVYAVTVGGNTSGDSTIAWEFYEHFA